jgi:hypothetical protein
MRTWYVRGLLLGFESSMHLTTLSLSRPSNSTVALGTKPGMALKRYVQKRTMSRAGATQMCAAGGV